MADVFRPDDPGKFPVILERTPYNRAGDTGTASELASHGYVVVIQDVRGRFASEGDFYPFRNESADGFDTVEWAAALPNSNGHVGMFGGSYVGATQMLAAIAVPPHLDAIFPYVTAAEYYEGWTYQGGSLMQWFASSWSSGPDHRHTHSSGERPPAAQGMDLNSSRGSLPHDRCPAGFRTRALLSGLGHARTQRRLLEALENFGSLFRNEGESAARRRLARHFSRRIHSQL